MSACTLSSQLDRCHIALKAFGHCMKERNWNRVAEHSGRINREMELLRMILIEHPELSEELSSQVRDLHMQLRRLQRILNGHIHAVQDDVNTLEHGIRRGAAAKAMLHS
ncbi:MAG: hypothetical protein ACE5E3_00565 [Mariprofundus sp.]